MNTPLAKTGSNSGRIKLMPKMFDHKVPVYETIMLHRSLFKINLRSLEIQVKYTNLKYFGEERQQN